MIAVRESLPLGRFIYDREWTPLWGAYIYPLRYFGDDRSLDPNDYLEVVRVLPVRDADVAITRGGGLFTRVRDSRRSEQEVARVTRMLNLVLCEFALNRLVSQPITDTDVQSAKLIGRHAAIAGGWGDYGERTWGPLALLASNPRDLGAAHSQSRNDWWPVNFYWVPASPNALDRIDGFEGAIALEAVGEALPALVVAAVFHASRHNIAETILSAWIVCEAVLSHKWRLYAGAVEGSERQQRLRDSRTYTASVQAEVLLVAGELDEPRYDLLQQARKIRNDLAHGVKMSWRGAASAMDAMRAAIDWAGPTSADLRGYEFSTGGVGPPQSELEPEFPFRQ